MSLNCIIIDDEPRAINILREYVGIVSNLQLLETFRNPLNALQFLKQNEVHLVFLDINMPNLSGIQFIKSLTVKPMVVLTTAYSEYAVESYQLDVIDYLLKPIEFDRFMLSINKVYDKINSSKISSRQTADSQQDPTEKPKEIDYIFIKNGTKTERIDLDEILYIEGSGNYIVYQLENRKIMALGKMSEALNALPKNQFVRIHKSHIVHLKKIRAIENNHVEVGGAKLSISSTYRDGFYGMI